MTYNLPVFLLVMLLVLYIKKSSPAPNPESPRFSLMSFYRSFIVLHFIFSSAIHFEFMVNVCERIRCVLDFFFTCVCTFVWTPFFDKSLDCLCSFVIDQMTVLVWIYVCDFCSIPLMDLSFFFFSTHCHDYCSIIIDLKVC